MGFALPPSFMAKTSEESADQQFIDVLLARCKVVEDIMGVEYKCNCVNQTVNFCLHQ